MIDSFPDTLVVVEYHVEDLFSYPWGAARGDFYNVWGFGIPFFAIDGLFSVWPISSYQMEFQIRQMVPAELTIDVSGHQLDVDTWRLTAEVNAEPGWQARDVRIYMVQVLDHWPSVPDYSRNTFKQAAATEDVLLQPGASTTVTRDFTFDADSMNQIEDVKIIVWVQEPGASMPAEIFQGRSCAYPFVAGDPADVNGDGVVNVLDLLAVLAAWGNTSGPEDVNGDGVVDVLDMLEVLANWG